MTTAVDRLPDLRGVADRVFRFWDEISAVRNRGGEELAERVTASLNRTRLYWSISGAMAMATGMAPVSFVSFVAIPDLSRALQISDLGILDIGATDGILVVVVCWRP
ncbi:MAG: hypothetical protein QOG67_2242 [Verrucomicrobiota bacterium]|jgi:hypothetical protein